MSQLRDPYLLGALVCAITFGALTFTGDTLLATIAAVVIGGGTTGVAVAIKRSLEQQREQQLEQHVDTLAQYVARCKQYIALTRQVCSTGVIKLNIIGQILDVMDTADQILEQMQRDPGSIGLTSSVFEMFLEQFHLLVLSYAANVAHLASSSLKERTNFEEDKLPKLTRICAGINASLLARQLAAAGSLIEQAASLMPEAGIEASPQHEERKEPTDATAQQPRPLDLHRRDPSNSGGRTRERYTAEQGAPVNPDSSRSRPNPNLGTHADSSATTDHSQDHRERREG